ncbi:hypothetical protein ACMZJR_001505 [Cronobacter turicensis]
MGKKDDDYQVVYRGEALARYVPGGLAFFQRPKECGGGYWLGRTCDGVFMFEILWPVSFSQGCTYLTDRTRTGLPFGHFNDDFQLELQ